MAKKNSSSQIKLFIFSTKLNIWNATVIYELLSNHKVVVEGIFIGSSQGGHRGLKFRIKRFSEYGLFNLVRIFFQKLISKKENATVVQRTQELIESKSIKIYGDHQFKQALIDATSKCDYTVLVYFNRIIPKKYVKYDIINLHAGSLPEYRGVQPVFWALLNGDHEVGISAHFIDDGIDTGPILYQSKISAHSKRIHEIMLKCSNNIAPQLVDILLRYNSKELKPSKQNKNDGNYYSRPKSTDVSRFLKQGNKYY